jgi:ubiquinone/menaquinone biosynthesis C-methylase UbiE
VSANPAAGVVCRDPADVVALYSRVARVYEAWGVIADSRVRRRVRELVRRSGGGIVVEAGCGTAALLVKLAADNPRGLTIGLDLAPGMVAAARSRIERSPLRGVQVDPGDVHALDFTDGSVDTLTCSYVLDILPGDAIHAVLLEFRRVLRPGGRVVLVNVTPAEKCRHRLPELLYGSALPLTSNCRAIRVAPLLHELGFIDVERRYVSQLGLPSEIVSATSGQQT